MILIRTKPASLIAPNTTRTTYTQMNPAGVGR